MANLNSPTKPTLAYGSGKKKTTQTKTYSTVMTFGTHGNDVFDPVTSYNKSIVDSNKALVSKGEKIDLMAETKARIAEQRAEARKAAEQLKAQMEETRLSNPIAQLNDVSIGLRKSQKYNQIISNLTNLAASRRGNASQRTRNAGLVTGGAALVGTVASFFSAGAGSLITLLGEGIGGLMTSQNSKDEMKAQRYEQMAESINGYLTNLTNRDTTILNTMDQIYTSMQGMRDTYGKDFVDTMYSYYLASNGMTPESYSLLTGNFNTFEGIGYGNISEENGVFDTLTDGYQNYFNNVYNMLSGDDVLGSSIMNSLIKSLYSANTEFGINLRGYETELRDFLKSYMMQENQGVSDINAQLGQLGAEARAENISAAETIGNAQAEAATSGARGGTSYANVRLAELSRDLTQMQRAAGIAATIGNLKYNYQNARLNASSTAYRYRIEQEKAINNAVRTAAQGFSSIGMSARSTERQANYYLGEAQSYERQFRESYDQVIENYDKNDADKMFQMIYG